MLRGFEGVLHVDGYGGYNRLADHRPAGGRPLRLAYCWAHARREFIKATPQAGSPVAEDVLARIAKLYHVEAGIRGRPTKERLAERKARSTPLLADLREALDHHVARLPRRSEMGRAVAYILARWEGLTRFAEDGLVEMDTNPVENAIHPLALGRPGRPPRGPRRGRAHLGPPRLADRHSPPQRRRAPRPPHRDPRSRRPRAPGGRHQ